MDSLTQLALGAAVGEAVMGKQSGRKAAAWGAWLGTFPDLDVFVPMGGPVADFIYHRSYSHSLLVLGILAPIWAWLITRLHRQDAHLRSRWLGAVIAIFYTHIFLDSLTVYGTQIFWPFTNYPVSIGSIFIIDPLYTVPLLIGGIAYLIKRTPTAYKANIWGLIISTAYLGWSVGTQTYVRAVALDSLKGRSLPTETVLVTPTPLNTFLWRIVSIDQTGYHVGYYSIPCLW